MDDGDFVVVKNIEQVKFTGKKFQIRNILDIQVIQVELKKQLKKNYLNTNLERH